MASGDIVGSIIQVMIPGSSGAQPAPRTSGSTPTERVVLYQFDATAIEYLDFLVEISKYAAGGFTVKLKWSAASATTGVVHWDGAFHRLADDTVDFDTAFTYVYNAVEPTTATVSGEVDYASMTFTDGADSDSVANNELCLFRLRRDPTAAADNMTGDAELWSILITET